MSKEHGFLRKISDIESAVISEPEFYCPEAKVMLSKLVCFITDADFTKSEVMKSLCKNFRKSGSELFTELEASGIGKSYNTIRSQISVLNKTLESLFGGADDIISVCNIKFEGTEVYSVYEKLDFSPLLLLEDTSYLSDLSKSDSDLLTAFYNQNKLSFDRCKEIVNLIDAVAMDFDVDFSSLIVSNLADDINFKSSDYLALYRDGSKSYSIDELQKEIQFLKTYSTKVLFNAEDGVDIEKLKYICYVMSRPIVGTDMKSINTRKVPLLKSFYNAEPLELQSEDVIYSDEVKTEYKSDVYTQVAEVREKIAKQETEKNEDLIKKYATNSMSDLLSYLASYSEKKPSGDYILDSQDKVNKYMDTIFNSYSLDKVKKAISKMNPVYVNAYLSQRSTDSI